MANEFRKLEIKNKVQETSDTVTVYFDIPEVHSKEFNFKAGQYITMKFLIDGKEVRRSYSLSTSPLQKDFGVTVKKVTDGFISKLIHDDLKVGDQVEVMAPDGRFYTKFDPNDRRDIYLIGAGSGITPLMSIARAALEEESKSNVYLLYGSRKENEIIFKGVIDKLTEEYEGQFFAEHMISSRTAAKKKKFLKSLFSKGNDAWDQRAGRIDESVIQSFLEEYPPKTSDQIYFICGPGSFIDAADKGLKGRGVDKKKIKKEYFVSASEVSDSAPVADGTASGLTAHLNGETINLPIGKKSILDTLLDADKDAPYSCHSGACATCMAKVLKGTAIMDACFALDEDEIAEGMILTCQAHPTSPEIEITYDV